MDNWSTEYKEKVVDDLNEAQDAVKALRTELEARRKISAVQQEEIEALRHRVNVLARDIEALKARLAAAEALATAARPFAEIADIWDEVRGSKIEGVHSVWEIAPHSIELYEGIRTALRQWQKAQDG